MIVGIIRHGETDWNRIGKMQGRLDIPLNENGIRQAEKCGQAVKGIRWGAVITSPLSRAMETARIVARLADIPRLEADSALMERDYGEASGLTREERAERFPSGTCPGMESCEDMADRMMESLQRNAARFAPENIILVSHGAAIAVLLARLAENDPEWRCPELKNTGVTLLSWESGEIRVIGCDLSPEHIGALI